MVEGTFPKVDGDIQFATEVNRFASAGRYVQVGSIAQIASGATVQDLGSILISPGSLSNPAQVTIDMSSLKNARDDINLEVSGPGANGTISAGSFIADPHFKGTFTIGSPGSGFINLMSFGNGNFQDGVGTSKIASLNDLDAGSAVVIKFSAIASANLAIPSFSVQSFRGVE